MSTLTAEFRRLLALPSASDHTALAATCPDDPAALVRAALAAGTEDEPALRQLVEAALEKTNPTIRAGGIQAAALLGWSSLAAPLLLAAAVEEDEDLKRQIRIALRKCTSTT
ncbi:hypothetical protein [Kineosphaera limosa]|nr:hypothetical protein [Kineosphaera limosa]